MMEMFLFAVFLITVLPGNLANVDVAMNKPTSADPVCGYYIAEVYFGHSEVNTKPELRTEHQCENQYTHPAEAMVDGDANTWWQSTSRSLLVNNGFGLNGEAEAIIIIDLQQVTFS